MGLYSKVLGGDVEDRGISSCVSIIIGVWPLHMITFVVDGSYLVAIFA